MNTTLKNRLIEKLGDCNPKDYSEMENLIINELNYALKENPDILEDIKTVKQLCSDVHEQISNTLYEVFPEIEAMLEETEEKLNA